MFNVAICVMSVCVNVYKVLFCVKFINIVIVYGYLHECKC